MFENDSRIDLEKVKKVQSLRDFDEEFTCKILGNSIEDYYEEQASYKLLGNIERPILFINSLDDPLLPAKNLPFMVTPMNIIVLLINEIRSFLIVNYTNFRILI